MKLPYISYDHIQKILKKHKLINHNLVRQALLQAIHSHGSQRRDDGSDVLTQHIFPIIHMLIDYYNTIRKDPDIDVLVAAFLHDFIEDDPKIDKEYIRKNFGHQIFSLIKLLTKNKTGPRPGYELYEKRFKYNEGYYHKIRTAPDKAKIIKLADRLNNLQCAYSNPDKNKIINYIRETEDVYLDISRNFPYLFNRISEELSKLKEFIKGTKDLTDG